MELDLDARAAEANLEDHKVTLGGKVYSLPAEVPLGFASLLMREDLDGAMIMLFDEDAERLMYGIREADGAVVEKPSLTPENLNALIKLYGLEDVGNSSASRPSLNRAGRRAKPTSKGSTAST
jgi:hypothetical protein